LLVKDGKLISPPRERVLEGVSLRVVSEIAARLGIALEYRRITLEDCYAAEEAILTCTSFCIAGVRRLNDRTIPWPGPMLRRLIEAWSADVGLDIHAQIITAAARA
jgi:branched-subunit amino acid aminotransferase/4-amino-4-deoxychorismate lyase